jgi:vitamin B12 transport system permease protein
MMAAFRPGETRARPLFVPPRPDIDVMRALPSLFFALLCAVTFGLAAGAIWMVPTMFAGRSLPWLALPIGWLLGQVVGRWIRSRGVQGGALAALATLLAATYTKCLVVAANIAGMMGIGFVDALREAGFRMLTSLAAASLGWTESMIYLLGAAIAAIAAAREPRKVTRPAS